MYNIDKENFKAIVKPTLIALTLVETKFKEVTDAKEVDINLSMTLLDRIETAEHNVWKAWAKATRDYNPSLVKDVANGSLKRLFPAARKLAFQLCDM